jgi:nucleotide-binding universal stress UspA family protein
MPTHTAIVPLDGSALSRAIVGQLGHLLDPARTRLVLLRVGEPVEGLVGKPARPVTIDWLGPLHERRADATLALHPIYESQIEDSERANLIQSLTEERRALEAQGFDVAIEVRFGKPAEEIVGCARERHADLIAMATHGRDGLSHLVLGSVADRVVRTAPGPVLVLRPPDPGYRA